MTPDPNAPHEIACLVRRLAEPWLFMATFSYDGPLSRPTQPVHAPAAPEVKPTLPPMRFGVKTLGLSRVMTPAHHHSRAFARPEQNGAFDCGGDR